MKRLLFLFLCTMVFVYCGKKGVDSPNLPASGVPIVTTNPIANLTVYSAVFSGKIVDSGASKIIEQGLVVDTVSMPTKERNIIKFIRPINSNGEFSIDVQDIPANKTWYVRAYAINSQGIGYGKEVMFVSVNGKVFNGDVTLKTQNDVAAFGANNYSVIKGSLFISGTVTDLTPLNSLVIIGNALRVNTTRLANFHGLENLEVVGKDVASINEIDDNSSLTSFSGLNRLKVVRGILEIKNNDALVDLAGFDNFTTIWDLGLRIEGCDNLVSLHGLEKMQHISGVLSLKDNLLLSDLSALSNLSTISVSLTIDSNPSLQKLDGFEKIKELEGFTLINNPALTDISAIRNIQLIKQSIIIDNNDALVDLSSFNNISATNFVYIKNNDGLHDLEGFKNLQNLQDLLYIENNSALTNFQGLRRLKSVSRIEVYANKNLQSLNGLDSLTTIKFDGYSILISSNENLRNLDGLQKVTEVKGAIEITDNPLLTDFCGLKALFSAGYTGSFSVQNNSSNPTKNEILSGCP